MLSCSLSLSLSLPRTHLPSTSSHFRLKWASCFNPVCSLIFNSTLARVEVGSTAKRNSFLREREGRERRKEKKRERERERERVSKWGGGGREGESWGKLRVCMSDRNHNFSRTGCTSLLIHHREYDTNILTGIYTGSHQTSGGRDSTHIRSSINCCYYTTYTTHSRHTYESWREPPTKNSQHTPPQTDRYWVSETPASITLLYSTYWGKYPCIHYTIFTSCPQSERLVHWNYALAPRHLHVAYTDIEHGKLSETEDKFTEVA